MTSLVFAQRLCRYLKVSTVDQLPMDAAEELREAMNAGLTEFASLLPPERLRRTQSWLVDSPRTMSLDVTDGSAAITVHGSPFPVGSYTDAGKLVGHSVTVADDPKLNRVQSATSLVQPWFGTTGVATATIFGDAIQMTADDAMLCEHVRFIRDSGSASLPLYHWAGADSCVPYRQIEHGEPRWWWSEPHRGQESVSEPLWLMRLWPLPSARGTVSATVHSFPTAIAFDDLSVARSLPVTTREEAWLVNLAAVQLIASSMLRPEVSTQKLMQLAEDSGRAMELAAALPRDTHPNEHGTPYGW